MLTSRASIIENAGKQFKGALHLYIKTMLENGLVQFQKIIAQVPAVFNDLAHADMVVFYCYVGSARSPGTLGLYQQALAARPIGEKKADQLIVVLDGGMTAYNKLGDAPEREYCPNTYKRPATCCRVTGATG